MTMLFGRNKLLQEGAEARGLVIRFIEITTNHSYIMCRLRVRVKFDDGSEAEFEDGTFVDDQLGSPREGDFVPVRYNPSDHSKITVDSPKLAAQVAAKSARSNAEAIARGEAELERSSIPESWILGRAIVVDVRKQPAGELVDCVVTVKARLVDGTPPYEATLQAKVVQPRADLLEAGRTITPVRADPADHSALVISWTEDVPVVTVTDSEILEPPARALADGQSCRIIILNHGRQFLKTPSGEELYGTKVRFTSDGSELQVMLQVPPGATALLSDGKELPAKRVEYEPNVVAVDWDAALSEAGQPPRSPVADLSRAASDPIVRLQQLADLHERGVLTDAEFAAEKAKVLGAN